MPLAIMGKRETKETKKKEEAKKKKELVCRFLVTGWCIYTYFSQAAAARKEKEKVKKVFISLTNSLCFVTPFFVPQEAKKMKKESPEG